MHYKGLQHELSGDAPVGHAVAKQIQHQLPQRQRDLGTVPMGNDVHRGIDHLHALLAHEVVVHGVPTEVGAAMAPNPGGRKFPDLAGVPRSSHDIREGLHTDEGAMLLLKRSSREPPPPWEPPGVPTKTAQGFCAPKIPQSLSARNEAGGGGGVACLDRAFAPPPPPRPRSCSECDVLWQAAPISTPAGSALTSCIMSQTVYHHLHSPASSGSHRRSHNVPRCQRHMGTPLSALRRASARAMH